MGCEVRLTEQPSQEMEIDAVIKSSSDPKGLAVGFRTRSWDQSSQEALLNTFWRGVEPKRGMKEKTGQVGKWNSMSLKLSSARRPTSRKKLLLLEGPKIVRFIDHCRSLKQLSNGPNGTSIGARMKKLRTIRCDVANQPPTCAPSPRAPACLPARHARSIDHKLDRSSPVCAKNRIFGPIDRLKFRSIDFDWI